MHDQTIRTQLETERLLIRRFKAEDWAALHEYLSDEGVVHYEPYPPLTQAQCQSTAERWASSSDFWAVCLKDGAKLIGHVYLAEKEQANWELGYIFHGAYQRRGYATEAAEALLRQVFTMWGGHRVYAACNPDNTASWRLLERLRLRREGHLRQNIYFRQTEDGAPLWQDTFLYAALAAEWLVF